MIWLLTSVSRQSLINKECFLITVGCGVTVGSRARDELYRFRALQRAAEESPSTANRRPGKPGTGKLSATAPATKPCFVKDEGVTNPRGYMSARRSKAKG